MENGRKKIESHRDLLVWQKGMDLVEAIYRVTLKLPSHEQFGLIAQLRRAAVSIPSNIAERYGRHSSGSYKQFLSISRGSLLELETQIDICLRLGYLTNADTESVLNTITEMSKMLTALISRIK
jgi:four helix bundle protein